VTQLREIRGQDCHIPAVVGIMDGIASGIVIAEPRRIDDTTLGNVRIYSRCIHARSVVLHMLLLMCDMSLHEFDSISFRYEGECIVAEAEDGTSAVDAGADGTPSATDSFPGMITRSKSGPNQPPSSGPMHFTFGYE
jgi:hypothetical protein